MLKCMWFVLCWFVFEMVCLIFVCGWLIFINIECIMFVVVDGYFVVRWYVCCGLKLFLLRFSVLSFVIKVVGMILECFNVISCLRLIVKIRIERVLSGIMNYFFLESSMRRLSFFCFFFVGVFGEVVFVLLFLIVLFGCGFCWVEFVLIVKVSRSLVIKLKRICMC